LTVWTGQLLQIPNFSLQRNEKLASQILQTVIAYLCWVHVGYHRAVIFIADTVKHFLAALRYHNVFKVNRESAIENLAMKPHTERQGEKNTTLTEITD
jgi:hypothetical protein